MDKSKGDLSCLLLKGKVCGRVLRWMQSPTSPQEATKIRKPPFTSCRLVMRLFAVTYFSEVFVLWRWPGPTINRPSCWLMLGAVKPWEGFGCFRAKTTFLHLCQSAFTHLSLPPSHFSPLPGLSGSILKKKDHINDRIFLPPEIASNKTVMYFMSSSYRL